jgi:chemotaxis protein histidine kinase CheA
MADNNNAQVFMPPNTLRAKLGSGPAGLDPDAVKRAEKAMDGLKTEFSDWLATDIAKLAETFDAFSRNGNAGSAGALFRAAHDLKGQATTFEYPLVARVAASLAKLMDGLNAYEAAPLPLVAAHVDAIHVIHRDKIKDISDLTALTLVEELEGRVTKALARAAARG